MLELLFLLLPIAAAYGYYMGRSSLKNSQAESKTESAHSYLKGVDYLLNNEKERAVDKFIAYLNSADPSAENSIALGSLFRKRGEVDRAISLHSSLATDPKLEAYENELASIELAADFISAGLLDRAEVILLDLMEIPRQRRAAVTMLIRVYEQERDYDKALETGLNNRDIMSAGSLNRLANYRCELAAQMLAEERYKEAGEELRSAGELNPASVRVRIMECDLLMRENAGDVTAAVTQKVSEILDADPKCGLLCLGILKRCFNDRTDQAYISELESLVQKSRSAAAVAELCRVLEVTGRHEEAEDALLRHIRARPNLKLFSALLAVKAGESDVTESSELIMELKGLLDASIAADPKYSCSKCGFESGMMFWQCPSCRSWDTIRPKSSLAGD